MGQHGQVDLDRSQVRLLLVFAAALGAVVVWAFFARGADRPADPTLGQPADGGEVSPDELPGAPDRVLLEGFDEVALRVQAADGSFLAWCLLAALNAQQRAQGLMEVTDLQGYSGMAFVYEDDVQNAFHMRDTPMPLSIAWVAADGSVVTIADMEPCAADDDACPTYAPTGPYRYAIEVPQGGLAELGITEGATVGVGGSCAPVA